MRFSRKMFLAGILTLATMTVSVSSASAAIQILREVDPGNTNVACANLVKTGHAVTGGCHVVFNSAAAGAPLIAHTGAAEVQVSNCVVRFELRVDSTGAGWITGQQLTAAPTGTCTRTPCDEAAPVHTDNPWQTIIEDAGATSSVESTFCLRTVGTAEGTAGTSCLIHLPIAVAAHVYTASTAGLPDGEAACEGLPQVELSGTFTSAASGTERIEIVNN